MDLKQTPLHTLQQAHDPLAHSHVHVGLGGLQVIVKVVSEASQESHRSLLSPPVNVLWEDNCRSVSCFGAGWGVKVESTFVYEETKVTEP